MAWKTPKVVEICVGMEINSYVCAEIQTRDLDKGLDLVKGLDLGKGLAGRRV